MKHLTLILSLLLLPTMALAQTPIDTFILKVKPADLDKIGKGLGKLPFEDVADLMQSLRQQVIEQSQPKAVDNPPKEPEK